jgi:cobalamin biosynthesis Mg chelatase CobN
VSCNYTSGNAVLTLKNFANNTQTDTVSLTKPTDCVTASTNWSAVSGVIGAATGTDATPPNAPALPDTAATSDVTSPSESARTDQTSNPEQPAENSFSIWLPIGVGAAILAGIVGLVWWVLAHRRTMY